MGFYNKILFIALLILSVGCNSAKKCAQKYPCSISKEVIDSIVYHTDTLRIWQDLSSIPILKIKCFEYMGKDSVQVFRIPCNTIIQEKEIWRTQFVLDTAKIIALSEQLSRLQKDSLRLNQRLIDSNNRFDKKYYFYRNGFFWTWGVFFLLALFLIWRKTRKGVSL